MHLRMPLFTFLSGFVYAYRPVLRADAAGFAYLAPFFLLGLGVNRFRSVFLKPTLSWIIAACFLGAMTLHALTIAADGQIAERGTVLGLLIGVAGTLTLIYFFPHLRTLEWLGAYSLTVYLFHPFFVAASRAALKVAQITSTELGFAVGLAAGVLGPVALERILQRSTLLRRLLLGRR